jgi:hypothetical protein
MQSKDIDIVIPWVDGSDPAWQAEYRRYLPESEAGEEHSVNRYREWGLLPYWFRGVERYMPWVRKIHFVTNGQLPPWLNTDCEKLHLVKHTDILPADCLPIFSSRPIDMTVHRIPGLSEQFILFNDDFYILQPMTPDDFFHRGLPRDMAIIHPPYAGRVGCSELCDTEIVNRHFMKRKMFQAHPLKWLTPLYGKDLRFNLMFLPDWSFCGFKGYHQPQSYLKSTFEEVWQAEHDRLDSECHHRFRTLYGVNQYLFRYWQFATGRFYPSNIRRRSALYSILDWSMPEIERTIRTRSHAILVINDEEESDFERHQPVLKAAFESILPQKSSFERF